MPGQSATRLQISGHRFLVRRIEHALLYGNPAPVGDPARAAARSLLTGCLIAALVAAGCAMLGLLRGPTALGDAPIVIGQPSGALYVRLGDTWHPVFNLASARLIADADANPAPVRDADLARARRGPLLGIPGAPQLIGTPLVGDAATWVVCDTADGSTTVILGAGGGDESAGERTELVTADAGAAAYLLYRGRRALVDRTDPAVVRALRLDHVAPRPVSRVLLSALAEAPALTAPPVPGAGGPATLPGFPIGSVIRVARAGADDDYYVVLADGVQRVGELAADLLRFSASPGSREVIAVAPELIRHTRTVNTLPVAALPDRAPVPPDDADSTLCAHWAPGRISVSAGLPLPAGWSPVPLAQADGTGPALDAVALPPGRSAYVRSTGLLGRGPGSGPRYLVTDSGVRFGIPDDRAAADLGLPDSAAAAPWPLLATLPSGPELSRQHALVARDTVAAGAP